jgi:hypothetical protein
LVGATALAAIMLPLSGVAAAAAPGVTVTQAINTNGCNGVRTTPGSENTTKRLVGGTLVPGGTAIFEISFPFDPAKLTGQDTFKMTDCVFIAGQAFAKYFITGVPNGQSPFVFQVTVQIPADAELGASYCNYVKTTANPTAPQESNRKAGPACFLIGGDLRILKLAEDTEEILPGASFTVSCDTGEETVPPVVISGLSGPDSATTFVNGAYVSSGAATTGVIAIAGPEGTDCTVTETAAPAGYALADPATQEFTIPRGTDSQVEGTFLDAPLLNRTSITTQATSGTVGDEISDTATLSGATEGAGGTITFNLYGPSATPDCSGDPVFTSTVDVNGNGDYVSGGFTPTAAGSYYWTASYSGDEGNFSSAGECGADGETSGLEIAATSASSSPSQSVSGVVVSQPPIAATGAGPVDSQMNWALVLLVLGGAVAWAGRRGYRRLH